MCIKYIAERYCLLLIFQVEKKSMDMERSSDDIIYMVDSLQFLI